MSSSPIEIRTRSSGTPADSSCSGLSCWWVVDPGWITRVRESPTLARCEASCRDSMNFCPAARPPFTPKENTEPGPSGRYFFARSKCGCEGRPEKFT